MKRPWLLLVFLLLALTCSHASSLARERSRIERTRDQATSESPYTCLDAPTDLPACRFSAEDDRATRDGPSETRRLPTKFGKHGSDDLPPIADAQARSPTMMIVYKIEGCIPLTLPFVLPICKQEDSIGRIVEVRRLFPFRLTGSSEYNSDATLVFPEVDMTEWRRLMHVPWTPPTESRDSADRGDKVERATSQLKDRGVAMTKTSKQKKFDSSSMLEKKATLKILKKSDRLYASKEFDENDIFSKFPSADKLQLGDDCAGDTDSPDTRGDRFNRIDDGGREGRDVSERAVGKASFTKYNDEFPYAQAIPYDPGKLRLQRINIGSPYASEKLEELRRREFLYSRAFRYEPRNNEDTSQRDEFPYAKAIPYDPDKLIVARSGSEFPYNRAIPYDSAKFQHLRRTSEFPYIPGVPYDAISKPLSKVAGGERNYGFPYAKSIPRDSRDPGITDIGSEFPYTRAIPYDPVKLRIATRGSEFPYAKAIPYDPKKLQGRWSEIIEDRSVPFHSRGLKGTNFGTKEFNSRVVPFDTRMLDAAKEGRIFPYGKAIPADTSKIRETVEVSRSRDIERIPVPVRRVTTFRDEEAPTYARKLQVAKNERRLGDIVGSEEVQRNIINTGTDDSLKKHEVSLQSRTARSALQAHAPDELTAANDNSEIPSRWSEFPYSKAIPFDSAKLRRPRSTMQRFATPLNIVPQAFPYAKAIPYDPSKLVALRRKKSKSHDERTIIEESKLLRRLKRSTRSAN